MHECMGIKDYFLFWPSYLRWCASNGGTFSIFGPLVTTTTSSFPSPHNQLPVHASIDLTIIFVLLSFFHLTIATCGRTKCFVFIN